MLYVFLLLEVLEKGVFFDFCCLSGFYRYNFSGGQDTTQLTVENTKETRQILKETKELLL